MGINYNYKNGKPEHRYVWEQANGDILKGMVIHHINGNARDNRLDNLIMVTQQTHMRMHLPDTWKLVSGEWLRKCLMCSIFLPINQYYPHRRETHKSGIETRCKECSRMRKKAITQEKAAKRKAIQDKIYCKICGEKVIKYYTKQLCNKHYKHQYNIDNRETISKKDKMRYRKRNELDLLHDNGNAVKYLCENMKKETL